MLKLRTLTFLFTGERAQRLLVPFARIGFFTVQPQCLKYRQVVTGEKDRVFGFCGVLLPAPRRDAKRIVLVPVETLAINDAVTASLDNMVNIVPE